MSRLRLLLSFTVALATLAIADTPHAEAQSDILLRLRSGSPAVDRFVVDSAAGVFAGGILGTGVHDNLGEGYR